MPTAISTLLDDAETLMEREFQASGPATLSQDDALRWVKAAYDSLSELSLLPRKSTSQNSVAGQNAYTIPTDCWLGFAGIVVVIFDGVPLKSGITFQHLMELYDEDWKAPGDISEPTYFMEWTDSTKFGIVKAPAKAVTNGIEVIHVYEVPVPASVAATLPTEFEQFRSIIPLYLVGRALQKDDNPRGAAFIAEFEGRVRKRVFKRQRVGRRSLGEGYTNQLKRYHAGYKRNVRSKSGL